MQPIRLRLKLPAGPAAPAAARRSVKALEPFVAAETLEDIQLLVTELVGNSLRHAELDASGWIEVAVEATEECVHGTVIDPGNGFAKRTPPVEGGWGLVLTDRIADRWGIVEDDLTRVWFEIETARREGSRR